MKDIELGQSEATRNLFGAQYGKAARFAQLLTEQGELRGLIGPDEVGRVWDRHILNSAALVPLLPESGRIADVGSGAGLPGLVLAIARPDLTFTLIEPMMRRCTWLTEVSDELELGNVRVVNARAEDVSDQFQVVTARAVAPAKKLIAMMLPLVAPGGEILALKGRNVAQELEKAGATIKKAHLDAPEILTMEPVPGSTSTTVLRLCRR